MFLDISQEIEQTNNTSWATYALPEKTKRGPPTNKNIPVRNIKAHISNMSVNESAGFKNEYNVRTNNLVLPFSFCTNQISSQGVVCH